MSVGVSEYLESAHRTEALKVIDDDTAVQLEVNETLVQVEIDDGTFEVTLPPVAEAKGKTYSIWVKSRVSGAMTLTHDDDSIDWAQWGDLTMDAANDRVLFRSDGRMWWLLYNGIA